MINRGLYVAEFSETCEPRQILTIGRHEFPALCCRKQLLQRWPREWCGYLIYVDGLYGVPQPPPQAINSSFGKELCVLTCGNVKCFKWPVSSCGWEGFVNQDTELFSEDFIHLPVAL